MSMKASSKLRDHLALEFISVGAEGVRMQLRLEDLHLNQAGTLHGGVVTTMIDIACAIAVRAHHDDAPYGTVEPMPEAELPIATLTLNTSFLATARSGTVSVRAYRRGGGRRIHFVSAEVMDQDGNCIATGDGSYTLKPKVRKLDPRLSTT